MKTEKLIQDFFKLYKDGLYLKSKNNKIGLGGLFWFLTSLANERKSYLNNPARVQWEVTQRCNLSCRQCYFDSNTYKGQELKTKECIEIVKQLKLAQVLWVEIQGGEPLLRKDIYKILQKLKEENIGVKLLTNGTLINDSCAKKLSSILEKTTDSIQISLDGSCPRINDHIRGEGSFNKIIKGIKNCIKHKLPFSVNTTLMDKNSRDLANIYKLLINLKNVPRFTFFALMHAGRGKKLSFSKIEEALKQAIKIKLLEKNNKNYPKIIGCLGYAQHLKGYKNALKSILKKYRILNKNTAAISSLDINFKGDIYPSSYLQFAELKAGNVKKKTLKELWQSKKWSFLRKNSYKIFGKCIICDILPYCGSGTKTTNYIDGKCLEKADIACLNLPQIKLKNLILRPPSLKDFNFLKNMWENGKVMEYIGFPSGLHQSNKKIINWIENWQDAQHLRLIIEHRKDKRAIGEIGFRLDNSFRFHKNKKNAILDIKIIPKYWSRGYGFESLNGFIKFLDMNSDFDFYSLNPNIKNIKAMGLYKKLQFKKKGKKQIWVSKKGYKGEYIDMLREKKNKSLA